tara:strand:- start:17 stop:1264 length:1248 start_codon:yes stop_codon:yes gene_type:complete
MALDDILRPLQQRRNRLSELRSQLKNQQDRRQELERAANDYKTYDPVSEHKKLDTLVAKAAELSQEVGNVERSKATLDKQLWAVRSKQINPVIFWKFFTAEQKQLRAEVDRLQRKILALDQRIESDKTSLSKTNSNAGLAKKRLAEHKKFDLESTVKLLSGFPESIERTKADLVALSAELEAIETRMQPHVQKHERLKSEISTLNADIASANNFDRNLGNAANSYEKAMIHQECEVKFGIGSPKQVIKDRSGQIRRLEKNDIAKLERRIREELEKSVRTVDHLLIDGNNVCYEGQSFIELRGLTALLSALAGRYTLTVVFDASIRSLLKASTQDIKRRLGPSVMTHIAPTKTGADEYLLKLAGQDKGTFIISNDRYAEYHEYDAVKAGRLFRFLIADGKLMANDLDRGGPTILNR